MNGKISTKFLFILIIFHLTLSLFPDINNPIIVKDSIKKYNICRSIKYLEDKDGIYKQEDVIEQKRWKSIKENFISFGNSQSVFWLKLPIINNTNEDLYLELKNSQISKIEIYKLENNNIYLKKIADNYFSLNNRKIKNRNFIIKLEKNDSQETYFIKLKSIYFIYIPIYLWTEKAFLNRSNWELQFYWMFYGILLIFIIFYFFYFFITKELSNLAFCLLILSWFLFHFNNDGFTFMYFLPNFPLLNEFFKALSLPFILIFHAFFFITFLELKNKYPLIYKIIIIVTSTYFILFLISFILPIINLLIKINLVFTIFVSIGYLIFLFVIAFYKKYKPALFLVIAFSINCIINIYILMILFFKFNIPIPPFTIMKFGVLNIILFCTMTIFYKVKLEKKFLEENIEKFKLLLKYTSSVAWITNQDGETLYISPNIEKVYGYTQEEIYKNGDELWFKRIHPDDIDNVVKNFQNFLNKKRKRYEVQYRIKRKDNKWIWLYDTSDYYTIIGNNKKIAYGVFSDITILKKIEKKLKENESRIRTLFEKMMNCYALHEIICDKEGNPVDYKFLEVNKAFEDTTNLKSKDIIGKSVLEVLPNTEDYWIKKYGKVALTGKSIRFENYSQELNKYFEVLAYSTVKKQFATIFTDITDRKKAEEEIKRLTKNLEKKVEDKTLRLNEIIEDLKSFSYSVSHDLRRPLRHVYNYSELLFNEIKDNLDEDAAIYFNKIQTSAIKMKDLIDDLLIFSRLSRNEMTLTDIHLKELILETKDSMIEELKDRNIEWKIKTLPIVKGDLSMLRQVIINLISNAIKYTRKRKKAIIEIGSKSSGNEYIIFIKDNGIGFNERHIDNLFGVFQRLHSDKEFEGSGIGLAIVKRIINRHGGRVWAEGEENKGATFYFSLPKDSII